MTPVKPDIKHRIRAILQAQGRSIVWLARETGYSTDHITRVDDGRHQGAEKFWKLINATLGEDARSGDPDDERVTA